MNYGTQIYHICEIIRLAGKEVNEYHILKEMEQHEKYAKINEDTLSVVLCGNKKYFNKDKMHCCECGAIKAYYTLSDEGKARLAEANRSILPITMEEYQSMGIMVQEEEAIRQPEEVVEVPVEQPVEVPDEEPEEVGIIYEDIDEDEEEEVGDSDFNYSIVNEGEFEWVAV